MREYHELATVLLQAEAMGLGLQVSMKCHLIGHLFADHQSKPIEALSADCDRLAIDRNISNIDSFKTKCQNFLYQLV